MRRQFNSPSGQILHVQAQGVGVLQTVEIAVEDGEPRNTEASARRLPSGELLVEVDGIVRTVHATVVGEQVWLSSAGIADPGGTTVRVAHFEARRSGNAGALGALNSVAAPMTGRIVVVHVQPGDSVDHEQPLVVVEAMKMEHKLLAPRAGVVAKVTCSVGDLVDGGVVLVDLEPEVE